MICDGDVPSDTSISHDRTTVIPIVSFLSANKGKLFGSDNVKVAGFVPFQSLTVMFGDAAVSA